MEILMTRSEKIWKVSRDEGLPNPTTRTQEKNKKTYLSRHHTSMCTRTTRNRLRDIILAFPIRIKNSLNRPLHYYEIVGTRVAKTHKDASPSPSPITYKLFHHAIATSIEISIAISISHKNVLVVPS